jgi:hypothetical protein
MELVALRPIYRGREWMIQPGQVFERTTSPALNSSSVKASRR